MTTDDWVVHSDILASVDYLGRYAILYKRRTFFISYDSRILWLQSGTDDIIQRGYILLSSLLLVGYAAQGASIHVEASELQTSLPSRDIHHVAISGEGYEALRAATGFLLTAKGLRLLLLGTYAWALPRFRIAHLVQAFFTLLPCLVFLRLFFVSEVVDVVGTLACGIMLEVLGKYIAGLVVHLGVTEKNKHRHFVPALEIGHVIEKTAAFFVLVSGEILIAVAYVVHKQDEIGPHGEYLRSCLGITLVFLLCWTYFDADSCKVFVHAIRYGLLVFCYHNLDLRQTPLVLLHIMDTASSPSVCGTCLGCSINPSHDYPSHCRTGPAVVFCHRNVHCSHLPRGHRVSASQP